MYSLLRKYGKQNPEKFNDDLIFLKKHDNGKQHIDNIFEALQVVDGVEYLGSTVNEDESTFPDWEQHPSDPNDNSIYVNVEPSRYMMINYKFRIFDKETGEEEIIEKYLYFPKLLENTYFLLNGNKFFPIFQIIDCCTYNNKGDLTLKTLLMLITIMKKNISIYDVFDNEYDGEYLLINLFKNKLNYLYYFFVDRGFEKTMEYFIGKDWEEDIVVGDKSEYDYEENADSYKIFELTRHKKEEGTVLFISNELWEKDRNFCFNLVEILTGRDFVQVFDREYWKADFGRFFSRNKNSYIGKADDIIISFRRILDNSSKKNLRLKDENKEDTFAIVRWMTRNFHELLSRDNMDLKYKRIRIYEYLVYDLMLKLSNSTYRLLNKQQITLADRRTLFSTITPMFIIRKCGTNDLVRYLGIVNNIELFNPSLKYSQRGHQGLGEGSNNVVKEYRGLHPSYIGKLGLTAAPAGDPGMSGTISPFFENKGFYFSDEPLD
jgi:hypothetical protein